MGAQLLIVEDDLRIADFLRRGLSEEGYAVRHEMRGGTAWPRMQRETWDLVILDWWLPDEDGLQLLTRFRRLNRQTPVLFLTARDSLTERIAGLDAGADDYLCKPFAFAELVARVRALLRRRDATSGARLEFADITIDLQYQRVTRAGQPLNLTAKELSLLQCFLHHPRKVMSRSRLYDIVWGDALGTQSNTLEVHIKELRRKLEEWGPRVLYTRRGRGYLLDDPNKADL